MNKSKHITNTFYYTTLPFLRNILSFITLPILTRYLSPGDYGILSLLAVVMNFGWIFYLGLSNATFRLYFKYKDDFEKLRELFSTSLVFIIIAAFFYGIVIFLAYPFLNSFFFKNKLSLVWILLSVVQYFLSYVNLINQYLNQNQYEGKKWFVNELIALFVQIPLTILLVLTTRFKFEALIISGFVAEITKFTLLYFQVRKYYAPIFKYALFKESFKYSWPNIPTSIMGFGYSYFDRIMLSRFQGLSQVGILDMSCKVSVILKMFMDGIGGTVSPITLELLTTNTEESLKKLANINLKLVFIVLFVGLAVMLFTKEMIVLLTTHEYHRIIYVVPIYIYLHIFGVLNMVCYWLVYYHQKYTFWQIPLTALALVLNTIANMILIPRYGFIGAAFATFISAGIVNIFTFILGLRLTPIPMNVPKIVAMFSMVFIETALLYMVYYLNIHLISGIVIKISMLLCFAYACMIMEIFKLNEANGIIIDIRDKIFSKFSISY